MKNIVKSIIAIAILGTNISCENEKDLLFLTPEGTFDILSPVTGDGVELSPETPQNPGLALTWSDANYGGTPTAITYTVEIDKTGDNFDTPQVLTSTTNTYASITSEELNPAVLAVGLAPFEQGSIDVRIVSTVGTSASEVQYSNVINYFVTPYTTETPKLWMPGSYQSDSGYGNNWTQSSAATLASEGFGNTNFEGYVFFNSAQAAPSDGFKFTDAPNWDNGIFGDDGSIAGVLTSPGDNIGVNAGYYRVTANTSTLTYNLTATQWGIAGNATTNGWDGMIPMTYNPATKKWSIVATLSTQAAPDNGLKFKANSAWDINLGDNGADGSAEYNGTNIGTTAGTYLIELDLSNPRQYTYTLTPQ